MNGYNDFLKTKEFADLSNGFDVELDELNPALFDFQKAIVKWALRRGRAAIFANTGLGKTMMQVEWAWNVFQRTGNRVLILVPLCVAEQTVSEGQDKLGYGAIRYMREFKKDGSSGIYVTNYDMIHEFEPAIREGYFDGIVLDESSIIKHKDSKTRNMLIELAENIPYRLSCTATPAPNDFMEFGNQAEFLGVMGTMEMLSMFFIHDSGETSKWRLKGHGQRLFWKWLSTWACFIQKPSDLGFSDDGYILPGLEQIEIVVSSVHTVEDNETLSGRNEARRVSIDERVEKAAEIVNSEDGQWIAWCNLNDESKKLTAKINGSIEVIGSDSIKKKEDSIHKFQSGESRVIVTKPSITGFGLNWQHCSRMVFVGLNDSFEQLYQAIRRCYRFGQKEVVKVYLITSSLEGAVLENIKRKEQQAEQMANEMIEHMRDFVRREVVSVQREKTDYNPQIEMDLPTFLRAS